MRWFGPLALALALALLAACGPVTGGGGGEPATSGTAGTRAAPDPTGTPTRPADLTPDRGRMLATVRALAGGVGPREATSPAYARASRLVEGRLHGLGYDVRRQRLGVPQGVSWGVPVRAGNTLNVIAEPRGFDVTRPHLVIGAHLDTVPQAPGAEDNASGVAVLLELARLAAAAPPRLPVVFVAFGAEEPRGPGDDDHHFGSRAYVAGLGERARAALVGMVSLDRVGVGEAVPVCTGGRASPRLADALLARAERLGIPAVRCDNRSSDHWSFERAGLTAARLGATPYAAYHSSRDRPGVVEPHQLARVSRLAWEALRTGARSPRRSAPG
ncbi:MAG: M28 family metallopeptidase [Carbonactinosporaceae bacterium]